MPHPVSSTAVIFLLDARQIDAGECVRFLDWLTPAELQRYQGFVRPLRQRQFLLGRALLRWALGRMLAMAPSAIVLQERPDQAPQLLAPAGAPFFSLSHSGHWIACALSGDVRVGLDIEMRDAGRDTQALAQQAFGDAQAAALMALPAAQRVAAFYQLWSEHEARYKLGPCDAAHCVALEHAQLSIVLCSDAPLSQAPALLHASPDFPHGAPNFP